MNDTFGHPIGDKVLIHVAQILKKHFCNDGLIGRIRGDEFAIFFYGININEELKKRIQNLLEDIRMFVLPELPILKTSISIGGVYLTSDNFDAFYLKADKALYQAKAGGKDRMTFI